MASEQNDAQTDFEIESHGSTSLTHLAAKRPIVVVSLPLPRGDQLEVSCIRGEHNLKITPTQP